MQIKHFFGVMKMFSRLFINYYLTTLPPVTKPPEKITFSILKHLSAFPRKTASENRLNGLVLLNVHKEIKVTPNNVSNYNILSFKTR